MTDERKRELRRIAGGSPYARFGYRRAWLGLDLAECLDEIKRLEAIAQHKRRSPFVGENREDWNSYGAKPTTSAATSAVDRIWEAMVRGEFRAVPRNNGGAQIEAHLGTGLDVEIVIGPDGEVVDD